MMTDQKNEIKVPYALAVYGEKEIAAVNKVLESGKTMNGQYTTDFEKGISSLFDKKYGIMVNSGSSANYLAFELLNLPKGSEVITPILTFSTVVAPIVKNNLVSVFVDVEDFERGTYLIDIDKIEENITTKTKVLMIPSLLGNIPDFARLRQIADEHDLWLIEDSCDTLGSTINGKPTGYFSDISTTSFYGSHIITAAGGGGMICVNDQKWDRNGRILRGWGRTSEVGDESFEERFSVKLNGMSYDSKFIFEKIGYNFLPLEISAAFGLAQLDKLKEITEKRIDNFNQLVGFFNSYKDFFILPKQRKDVRTNWLAFPLTIKDGPFNRIDIVRYLEKNGIQTRPLFTGNITKQPGFVNIDKVTKGNYNNTDIIMEKSFVIGCHQGIQDKHLDHIKKTFRDFLDKY